MGFGLDFYLDAFYQLDTDRNELNYIPWSSMNNYANEYGLKDYEREEFYYIIRKIDQFHIEKLRGKYVK